MRIGIGWAPLTLNKSSNQTDGRIMIHNQNRKFHLNRTPEFRLYHRAHNQILHTGDGED